MEKQTGLLEGEVFCPDAIFCSVLSLIENHCLLLLKSVSIHQLLDILYVVCRIDSVREENNNNSSNGVPLEQTDVKNNNIKRQKVESLKNSKIGQIRVFLRSVQPAKLEEARTNETHSDARFVFFVFLLKNI
jgi:hypothetical protein